jgi:hypothetical protein
MQDALELFFEARNKALDAKLAQLNWLEDQPTQSWPNQLCYLNEYGTLKLAFGRRTGATYWMAHAARRFSELLRLKGDYRGKVALFVHSNPMRRRLEEEYLKLFSTMPENILLPIKPDTLRGSRVRYAFIDVSCVFSDRNLEEIYNLICEHCRLVVHL